jgi:hypothetical protein
MGLHEDGDRTMNSLSKFFYGKECLHPSEGYSDYDIIYTRFSTAAARDNWVERASNRHKVRSNAPEITYHLQKNPSWHHVEGVSYMSAEKELCPVCRDGACETKSQRCGK